jgi:CRISPR-associated protein Csx17
MIPATSRLDAPQRLPVALPLEGCAPEPLLAYLKALGILRCVAEQKDPAARGHWQDDVFVLTSELDAAGLVAFFSEDYTPTPIVSPWNGGSGFYPKDNKAAIGKIAASTSERLGAYRATIGAAQAALGPAARDKPDKDKGEKLALLRRLRSRLPDAALAWLDTVTVETDAGLEFAPLLGTGGNDGRLDFSQNYMQRVVDVVLPADPALAAARLRRALFGTGAGPLVEAAIGQFDPGGVGGPNARPGFEAESLVNPWDFVLLIEGALLFAGSVARRYAGTPDLRAAFPFMVGASAAGWGSLATADAASARAELWLPLWPRPAGLAEVRQLFAEGRAQVGRRAARNGVDFARAVAGLGVDRGIAAFQRYGFHQRSGNTNYLAAPLGRLVVHSDDAVRILDEVDPWLGRLRAAVRQKETPARYGVALRGIEEAILGYCRHGGPRRLQDVLAALGRAERELAVGGPLQERVRPLQGLSPAWLRACDDGAPELRVAAALASIGTPGAPLRAQLEPVAADGGRWAWSGSRLGVVWDRTDLAANLAAVLARRRLEGQRRGGVDDAGASGPNRELRARYAVGLGDVARYLAGRVDDDRIADLAWALGALRWAACARDDTPRSAPAAPATLPRAYALLKLLHLTVPLATRRGDPVAIPTDPSVLARLDAGDVAGAVAIAYRRLRARGLVPLGGAGPQGRNPPDVVCAPPIAARLAGALLIPTYQTERLARLVLRPPEEVPAGND